MCSTLQCVRPSLSYSTDAYSVCGTAVRALVRKRQLRFLLCALCQLPAFMRT
jgi:hypothetical protein